MSVPQKETVESWETDLYTTRIQRHLPWAGAATFHCRVRRKIVGGLFYSTVVNKEIENMHPSNCKHNFAVKGDTITVDICRKITSLR